MKRAIAGAALFLGMGVTIGAASEVADNGTVAIGFHGVGGIYSNGRPTVRWKKSDATSVDLTPEFSYQNNGANTSQIESINQSYGVTLGIVKNIKETNGLRIGLLTNLHYVYGFESITPQPTDGLSYTYNRYVLGIGIGPDIEYFIPAFPHLSIGAQGIVQYQYAATTTREAAGTDIRNPKPSVDSHSTNVNLLGEVFTVRYYF